MTHHIHLPHGPTVHVHRLDPCHRKTALHIARAIPPTPPAPPAIWLH